MNSGNITITILAVICVAGAIGAILYAAAADTKLGVGAGRVGKRRKVRKSPQETSEAVESVAVESDPAQPAPTPVLESEEKKRTWNMPHARNSKFSGRQKLIEEIRSTLMSRRCVSLVEPPQTLGGVGKTHTVVEYAHKFAEEYEIVWWLRATHPSMLAVDFAALATELGLKMEEARPADLRESVKHALAQRNDWLLVFDDAADPETVREYIPGGDNGHIIITSQVPDWWLFTVPITINGFERIESIDMLFGRTKQTNGAIVTQVAGLLHDLPLAMEHACSFVSRAGKSTTDYLTLFRARKKEVTSQISDTMERLEVVIVTCLVSIEQACKEANGSDNVLNALAFFSAEGIPVRLLTEALADVTDLVPGFSDVAAFKTSLSVLQRYSLLEMSSEMIFVHGLVQAAVRSRMAEDQQLKWAEVALRLNQGMFAFDPRDKKSVPDCSLMLPHALAVANHAEALGVASEATATLLDEIAVYLRSFEEYAESKKLAARALAIAEVTFGSAHPRVAVCADTLGATLQKLGDLSGARSQYERALSIDEMAYGATHPSVATRLGNLGSILSELGNPSQARVYLERALAIAESTYGVNHANVASRAANLAYALMALGEYGEAKKLIERALRIDEAVYGMTHPGVAERVHGLGVVLTRLGEIDRARGCFDRALRIEQSTYGHDHPRVAIRVDFLGQALENSGDLEGARDCYEEALGIDEAVYGQLHPRLAARIDALGRVLERMGDFKTAKDCYMQALAIEEVLHGSEHVNVAEKVIKLGNTFRALGDLFSARAQFERAIEIHQTVYGPTHAEVANDLVMLGNVLNELGDSKTARVQLGRALLIRQEHLGLTHPDTESVRKSLAAFAY